MYPVNKEWGRGSAQGQAPTEEYENKAIGLGMHDVTDFTIRDLITFCRCRQRTNLSAFPPIRAFRSSAAQHDEMLDPFWTLSKSFLL